MGSVAGYFVNFVFPAYEFFLSNGFFVGKFFSKFFVISTSNYIIL